MYLAITSNLSEEVLSHKQPADHVCTYSHQVAAFGLHSAFENQSEYVNDASTP